MTIRESVQEALKEAMKNKNQARLDCLRMAKGAILLKEKEKSLEGGLGDEEAAQALRAEVKKRQQSIELYRQHGKLDVVSQLEIEISTLEEFLPKQLDEAEIEAKVRNYLQINPEMNHAGKLTGAMKKELGESVDGRLLNDICKRVLE